jgi:hypothetical protein
MQWLTNAEIIVSKESSMMWVDAPWSACPHYVHSEFAAFYCFVGVLYVLVLLLQPVRTEIMQYIGSPVRRQREGDDEAK